MNIFKNIAIRIIPVGILTFVIVAAIAYQRGVYDITFIERPTESTSADIVTDAVTDIDVSGDTQPADTTTPEVSDTTAPVAEVSEVEEFLGTLSSTDELAAGSYTVTDEVWDSARMKLTRLNCAAVPADGYSLRMRAVSVPERVSNLDDSGYTTVLREQSEPRPVVDIYMDYILIDNGITVDVLSRDGKLLVQSFDISKYQPAYTRDKSDRALFKTEEPSQSRYGVTVTKYYYLDETGKLVASDYDDTADSRGLYMNYPTYYARNNDGSRPVGYNSSEGLYGYSNANGWSRTGYKYKRAFSFSEGLGCIVDENGWMHWVNENFITKVSEMPRYRYNGYHIWSSSNRRIYHVYLLPDTFGEKSRGMFYFEHGLVIVRRQTIDAGHYDLVGRSTWDIVADTELLLRADDTVFPLPPDYNLVSYSNGMILLEKGGRYGFMDYTGKWIVQPTYTYAKPYNEGLAVVGKDGKYGLIDTNGEFVLPMIFDHVESVSGGIAAAWSQEHGWMLFSKMKQIAVP